MRSKHITLVGLIFIIADALRVLRASDSSWLEFYVLPIAVGAALGVAALLGMRWSNVGFSLLRIVIGTIAIAQVIVQAVLAAVELTAWEGAFFRHLGQCVVTFWVARSAITAHLPSNYHRFAVACVLEASALLWIALQGALYRVQPIPPYPFGMMAVLPMALMGTLWAWHTHRRTATAPALPPASIA